jgi:hypothetical protein
MQNLPVYLYPNSFTTILDLDPTVRGVNRVMYQRDLKVQKGIKNQIRVQFKNSDQKRISISNTTTFVFTMFDAIERRQLVQKQLTVLDDGVKLSLRGVAQLTFTESDTIDLKVGSYQFSITQQDPSDGTFLPAYSNTYYGIAGTLEILEDIYPVLQPSQEVTAFTQTLNLSTNLYNYSTGNIYAYPEYNGNTALHTMAMYMTRFRGTVLIQGTLSNDPRSTDWYSTITTLTYDNFTGVDYSNFNGIYTYVRVIFIPAANPITNMNDDSGYSGSFDKLLYRC